MSALEVIQNQNKVIILNKHSNRTFVADLDKKIPKYGFRNLNQKEIMLNKLHSNDYAFYENITNLIIKFEITNGAKSHNYELECDEIFIDAKLDENAENVTNEDLKKIITSLRHQVTNLTQKLKEQEEDAEMHKNMYINRINQYRYKENDF